MRKIFEDLLVESEKVLFDRREALTLALISLLAKGHLLLEDSPGVGKTSFALGLSGLLHLPFRRIQMTSDLMPADVLGTTVFQRESSQFLFKPGPIFSSLVLADELNRASPRTQSAFLEAMEERQVTHEGQTQILPRPFFVIATQNPLDQAGTHLLPSGQLDRFLICLTLGPPGKDAEMRLYREGDPRERIKELKALLSPQDILEFQSQVEKVAFSETLATYLHDLISSTRLSGAGLSPRAGQHAALAARARAFLEGRDFALPEDLQFVAPWVWGHRLGEGQSVEGREKVRRLLQQVRVPL